MASEHFFVVMRHSTRLDMSDPDSSWSDKVDRPYDTPISDIPLAESAAEQLKLYGINVIITSPLRRCIQTAGIVARALGVRSVVVDFRLTEVMHSVRATGVTSMSYLSDEEIANELGDSVSVSDINRGNAPPFDEEISDSLNRYKVTFIALAKKYANTNALCISHGNAVEICGSNFLLPPVLPVEVNECGFIAAVGRTLHSSNGITLLPEDDTW